MSWATEYRGEFYDDRGLIWRVDIELDGYEGAINEMTMTGDPLRIEWLAPGDDLLFSPVKGSVATIGVWSTSHFQYTSLYSAENLKRRVSIYYVPVTGSTLTVDSTEVTVDSTAYTADDMYASAEGLAVLYWRGYLTADYSEPYDDTPYRVTLTAADGLGLLKDMIYKYTTAERDDTYYTGRRYESQVVLDILGKLGFTEFKEFCNIYEDNISDGVGDSPFDQILIDMDVFKDMYCYEVLEEVLKKYNAIIRQINGQFYIFRPAEFDAATCYGRYFTAYDTKTAITCTPEQLIHRTTNASDIKDFNGGVLMLQPPLNKVTVRQDYGHRESWLKNYKMSVDTWDRDASPQAFEEWTHLGAEPLSYYPACAKELDGILMQPDGTGSWYYAFTMFGDDAVVSNDSMMLSFQYMFINTGVSSASDVVIYAKVNDVAATYYLNNTGTNIAAWDNAYHTIEITTASVPVGVGAWNTAFFTFEDIPADGPYYITFYATNTANVKVAFKDIRFTATSDELLVITTGWERSPMRWYNYHPVGFLAYAFFDYKLTPKLAHKIEERTDVVSRLYEKINDIDAPEKEIAYILGDCENTAIANVLSQFKGALAYYAGGSLRQTAVDFVSDFADDYAALTSPSVLLTSDGNTLYFTSATAGQNFTGSTTIVNATGDLAGTVTTVTANATGTKQKETLTFTAGSTGDFTVYFGGVDHTISWTTNLETTLAGFVTTHGAAFLTYNITVTSTATTLVFEETVATGGFLQPFFVADDLSDYEASWATSAPGQVAPTAAVARVDKIVLSGTSGTATVTCHGNAETITFNTDTVLDYTASWHTRGNTEAKPVIELVADEIAAQYAREKHFIQMSLRERGNAAPDVNMLYNIQDDLNTYSGSRRVFVANRGTFDVLRGEWSLDAHEIL